MVNLVVRHGSHVQATVSSPVVGSPTAIANRIAKASAAAASSAVGSERVIPSPIRVPYSRNPKGSHRPVSPLTASESMFGMMQGMPSTDPVHSVDSAEEERQQPSETSINCSSELVCDYDQSITALYEMLESSQWEQARDRCRSHPQEVHTWIVRRDAKENVRWKLLPLHAAVIFQAPLPVVEEMLTEYPVAAAKRDDQGMLPLHLAFRHKSDEVLTEKLMRQYPGGVTVKDRRERFPLDHAKDAHFSFNMMQLYAETYAKCQHLDRKNNGADIDEKSVTLHENRLSTIKEAYEARIKAMTKDHDHVVQEMKIKMDKETQATQSRHDVEMDELRDLLTREMASGPKVSQLEAEMSRLADALAEANQERQLLRRVVHEQKSHHEVVVNQLHQILDDQKTLHDSCLQQQEQLDQAHQLREQLLRTLLQKEDGNIVHVSNEVCQLSNKILARTKKILDDVSHVQLETVADIRDIPIDDVNNAVAVAAGTNATGKPVTPSATPWGAIGDHGDDISAITENSNF